MTMFSETYYVIVYIQLRKLSQAYHCLGLRLSRPRTKCFMIVIVIATPHRFSSIGVAWCTNQHWTKTRDSLSSYDWHMFSCRIEQTSSWNYICNLRLHLQQLLCHEQWEKKKLRQRLLRATAANQTQCLPHCYLNMNVTRLSGILWDNQEISITLIVFHLSLGTLRGSVFLAPTDILFRDISYFGQL